MSQKCKVRGCQAEIVDSSVGRIEIDARFGNGNHRVVGEPLGHDLCDEHGRRLVELLEPAAGSAA